MPPRHLQGAGLRATASACATIARCSLSKAKDDGARRIRCMRTWTAAGCLPTAAAARGGAHAQHRLPQLPPRRRAARHRRALHRHAALRLRERFSRRTARRARRCTTCSCGMTRGPRAPRPRRWCRPCRARPTAAAPRSTRTSSGVVGLVGRPGLPQGAARAARAAPQAAPTCWRCWTRWPRPRCRPSRRVRMRRASPGQAEPVRIWQPGRAARHLLVVPGRRPGGAPAVRRLTRPSSAARRAAASFLPMPRSAASACRCLARGRALPSSQL